MYFLPQLPGPLNDLVVQTIAVEPSSFDEYPFERLDEGQKFSVYRSL